MSILERIEQTQIAPEGIFSFNDQQVLEDHHRNYLTIRGHLMAALNNFELRLEKVLFKSEVVLRRNKYEFLVNPQRTGYFAMMYDVAEDVAKVKNKLIQLNTYYTEQVAHYLNATYNLSLEFKDYGIEKIGPSTLSEAVQAQLPGLSLTETGTGRLIANFASRVRRPVKIKNRVVQLEAFAYVKEGFVRGYQLDYSERDKMMDLLKALTYFERETIDEVLSGLRKVPGYDYQYEVAFEEYEFSNYRTIQGIRFYKNQRLDLRFTSFEQARAFANTFRLPLK